MIVDVVVVELDSCIADVVAVVLADNGNAAVAVAVAGRVDDNFVDVVVAAAVDRTAD